MKFIKLLLLFCFLGCISCDEDELLSDSRDSLKFEIQLINNNFDVCSTIPLTYLIDKDKNQTSYDVASGNSKTLEFNIKKGEFIGITAYNTNDSSNTILAFANIDTSQYSKDKTNRLRVYYTECPVIDKILWIPF